MVYQYGGKLRGANDPWNQPADPYQEREKHPTGVVPTQYGTYKARAKHNGKYVYNGTHPTIEAAVQAVQVLRARIQEADPNYLTRKRCGTEAAYRRHLRNGEEACEACKAAGVTAKQRRQGRRVAAETRVRCGTNSGYQTHIHHQEEPCQPCRDARAVYVREYRAKQAA